MHSTLKHYTPVALLMAGLVLLGALCTALWGIPVASGDRPQVLAVNYPLYLAARTVAGDTDTVQVTALGGNTAGCLHDYQLSPADRLAVARADRILQVGENTPFLQGLVTDEQTVDTAVGLDLLCGHHHHEGDDHHDHGESVNDHLWMSPWRYRAQVQTVAHTLATLDPDNAATYLANGDAFGRQIVRMGESLKQAAQGLPSRTCVVFHDSLTYLAQDMGLTVALSLNVGEDSGLSPGDLARVQELVRQEPGLMLLYDNQYSVRYAGVDGLVPARQVLSLDTVVSGDRQGNDWMDAMEYNLQQLQGARG